MKTTRAAHPRRKCPLTACLIAVLFHAACAESREHEGMTGGPRDAGHADASSSQRFSPSSLPTYTVFCEALTEVYCSTMEECCGEDDVPFQREVCDSSRTSFAGVPDALCGSGSPTSYDADAAAECLSLRTQLAPSCNFRRLDDSVVLQAQEVCDRVATHQLPGPGEVCEGICSAPAGMVSTCDFVFDSGEPSRCSQAVTPGERGENCAQGRFCQPPSFCDSGTCRELRADGAECIQDDECESGSCSDDQYPTKRHCEKTRRVVREECLVYTDPVVRWAEDAGYQTWSDGGFR